MSGESSNAGDSVSSNQFDIQAFIRSIVASAGSSDAALVKLGRDNMKYRRRLHSIKEELDGLKTRNPDGSIVLVGEQITQWNALKDVLSSASPDDLKKMLKEVPELREKLAKSERFSVVASAAADLKFKQDVLEDLLETKGLQLVKQDVSVQKEDGTSGTEKRWFVKHGDAAPVLIEDSSAIKPYLPALASGTSEETRDDGENGRTKVPEQRSSTKGSDSRKKEDTATAFLAGRRYATPSELAAASKNNQ